MLKLVIIISENNGVCLEGFESVNLPTTKWEKEVLEKLSEICRVSSPPDKEATVEIDKTFFLHNN